MNSWRSTDIEVYITGDKKEIGWVKLPVSTILINTSYRFMAISFHHFLNISQSNVFIINFRFSYFNPRVIIKP